MLLPNPKNIMQPKTQSNDTFSAAPITYQMFFLFPLLLTLNNIIQYILRLTNGSSHGAILENKYKYALK